MKWMATLPTIPLGFMGVLFLYNLVLLNSKIIISQEIEAALCTCYIWSKKWNYYLLTFYIMYMILCHGCDLWFYSGISWTAWFFNILRNGMFSMIYFLDFVSRWCKYWSGRRWQQKKNILLPTSVWQWYLWHCWVWDLSIIWKYE